MSDNQSAPLVFETITVIIPVMNDWLNLRKVLFELNNQTLRPSEIMIVDSSSDDEIEKSLSKFSLDVPLRYLRAGRAFWADRFILKYLKFFLFNNSLTGRAYPYEATNLGAKYASGQWIAFLDTSTNPASNWLEEISKLASIHNLDLVIGKTRYFATSWFQKLLHACTYGANSHETMPGSIIKTDLYLKNFHIKEGVRAGGDVEWRRRVKENFKWAALDASFLSYSNLPNNLFSCSKKMFIYQLHSARVDIQHTVKDIYLGLFLFLSVIIIPKWNSIVGWESSALFIPNITKIYLLSITSLFLISLLLSKGFFSKLSVSPFILNILRFIFLTILLMVVYRWNSVIANWVEDSVWFIPHITKIFIGLILLITLCYRGIYFPLTHGIAKNYLFPFNWFVVGLLGIFLDIVKAPGYLIGSVLSVFVKRLN